MIVLGIDPGTANTGFGVVAQRASRLVALDGGVIATDPSEALPGRLLAISRRTEELIAEHGVEAVAVEDIFFGRNVGSALAVGQAKGAVLVTAARAGIPCESYTPQQVKGAVCGRGRADKQQIQRTVQMLLGLGEPPRPDHAADALAVAVCHLNRLPVARALSR